MSACNIASHITERYVWYAMRVTYRREIKARDYLAERGIETYIPMHSVIHTTHGHKCHKMEPAIHNLIFVHTTPSTIQQIKSRIEYLQYIIDRNGNKIIVPDGQMEQFIAVTSTTDNSVRFFPPEHIDIDKGTRVRIHGGTFDGCEGIFVKVKGIRTKRVVITIPEIAAVAIEISPDLIEKI